MKGRTVRPAEILAIELGAPRGDRDGKHLVPMLCGRDETGERVLTDSGWLFEVKLDGVRILADKRGDWTDGSGTRSRLGALDVAAYDGERLVARGSVGSGLDDDVIDALLDRLRSLEMPKPVVAEGKLRPKRGRHFTRPEVVVSVRYMGISKDGLLRHPVFRGVRMDLAPEDCVLRAGGSSFVPDPGAR